MRELSEAMIAKLKTALLTAMLDIAEDLSADHVDEILPEEILDDEQVDTVRAITAEWLVYEVVQAAGIELMETLSTAQTSPDLRAKYPHQAFGLGTGFESLKTDLDPTSVEV